MTDLLPAWSEPFHAASLGSVPALGLPERVDRAWLYGDGSGRGVRVAVVDSGVDGDHPAVGGLVASVAVERDASNETGVRIVEGPHEDLFGHGNACAGVIREVAPEVELISVRVLGADLKGSARAFAHGLEWCIDQRVDVVNLSLSTANDSWAEVFWELLDRAAYAGVLVVSALNNERKRSIPSEFAGVFSVACAPGTDRERVLFHPGGPAEWGAAGIDVDVAWSAGSRLTATGNSFAAPVVAGHLARIVGAHPGITPWQARTLLGLAAVNAEDGSPR